MAADIFVQSAPRLGNQYRDDAFLRSWLRRKLPADVLEQIAAELETMTYSPNAVPLMERVIQTQQMITVRKPLDYLDETVVERTCDTLVRFLASATGGVYQIDGRGWFSPTGELLVEEF